MNTIFLTARYPPDLLGGGEVSTRLIAEALAAFGASITVLTAGAEDREDSIGGVRVLRSRALRIWQKKPLNEARTNRRGAVILTELLQRYALSPDIIHAHEFRSAMTLAQLSRPNRVVTIRDYAPICGTTSNLWWDGSICDECSLANVLFRCHRVVEASLIRKPFRAWQYKGNLRTRERSFQSIPHHVYTSRILEERVAQRLHIPPNVTRTVISNPLDPTWIDAPLVPAPQASILYGFGRLEYSKGTDVLLDACALLVREFPSLHLHLGGGETDHYRVYAERFGLSKHITFHGAVLGETVRALIDGAAIVVAAHRWEEPFGRAVLEAGVRSRPLITADRGGVRETTTEETAIRVPPNDAPALTVALRALLSDRERRARLGAAARQFVTQHFSPTAIAAAHQALYATVTKHAA